MRNKIKRSARQTKRKNINMMFFIVKIVFFSFNNIRNFIFIRCFNNSIFANQLKLIVRIPILEWKTNKWIIFYLCVDLVFVYLKEVNLWYSRTTSIGIMKIRRGGGLIMFLCWEILMLIEELVEVAISNNINRS